ncbi:MAG: GDP-mannose 4,6-dehydratase, partial [Euryarchaeota archaeon]|nr:GDP-mannose 4,6-dehydratase [Euryarchaeota archaeon]
MRNTNSSRPALGQAPDPPTEAPPAGGGSKFQYTYAGVRKNYQLVIPGLQDKLYPGNLEAKDWGYAKEYVEAMWLMLQQNEPEDYVIATGETHSVREFLTEAFKYAGLDWQDHVEIDPRYFRPTEVDVLISDSRKAQEKLGWKPEVRFKELVKLMVNADLEKEKVLLN